MQEKPLSDPQAIHAESNDPPELALSDEDILDAMRQIPGYLDITTQDFRAIYHLAHNHALDRLFRQVCVGALMRTDVRPLHAGIRLDEAL